MAQQRDRVHRLTEHIRKRSNELNRLPINSGVCFCSRTIADYDAAANVQITPPMPSEMTVS